jgi:Zn-dependent metalloprotease
MKRTFLFSISLFLIAGISLVQGQNNRLSQIGVANKNSRWIEFRQNLNLNPATVFIDNKYAFGLGAQDMMKIISTKTDQLGYTHYRYQQYYCGIPVDNTVFIIHAMNNKALRGNGNLEKGISISVIPQITPEQAIQSALAFTKAEKYMWESKKEENLLKYIKSDNNATYYPVPQLVIVKGNNLFKLAWKMDLYAQKPLSRNFVYVDASNGNILKTINRIETTDVPGVAVTKYSGTQNIITDSLAVDSFRLRETTHGNGVETYDMNQGTNYGAAVDFTDADNYWNNVNANQDEAATDAHFAAEKTYEYYKLKFNRSSYDDADAKLMNYVHYDVNYENAFWDGTKMTYGDGNVANNTSAFTSLDVGGHEITHAVTEHTANLTYQDESGALNEGFSDIFGTCVEFFADSIHGDYYIGEDFDLTGGHGFRDMSNPKANQLPNTYLGQYWYVGTLDNGGVHTNMGVISYWFYLLAEGGSGTNDIGNSYHVIGIGRDTAAAIAYRTLSYYLVNSSNYADTREASIQAAIDLYGNCSPEVIQVANAWYAVGVGSPMSNNDIMTLDILYPVTGCGMSATQEVVARFKYNGCNLAIATGDTIPVSYRVDGGTTVHENAILASPLNGGDTLTYTFVTTFDASVLGTHHINCWASYAHDTVNFNDTLTGYTFESKLQQNIDVGVIAITEPVSGCSLTNVETVKVKMKFFGCDSIPANDSIVLAFRVDGGTPYRDTLILANALHANDTIDFTFGPKADLSLHGNHTIDSWTEYDVDTLNANDAYNNYKVENPFSVANDTVGFEESNILNLMLVETTPYSHAFVSPAAHHTGAKGFLMTGGNVFSYLDMIQFPDGTNNWAINEFLSAKIHFCVDATSWTSANLRFDLKQTYGKTAYESYLPAGDYSMASNFRVLVNGTQIGGTYNPPQANNDVWATHYINLDAYAGTYFDVTFETRNISKDTLIFVMDNAYLDVVCFSELPQSINETDLHLFRNAGIYPNPSNGEFNLQVDAYENDHLNIQINDLLGRNILSQAWSVGNGINKTQINLSKQAPGVYFLQLISVKGMQTLRVIKQ